MKLVAGRNKTKDIPTQSFDEMLQHFLEGQAYLYLNKERKDVIEDVHYILLDNGFTFSDWPGKPEPPIEYLTADWSGPYHFYDKYHDCLTGRSDPIGLGIDETYIIDMFELIDTYTKNISERALTDDEYLSVLTGEEEHV